MTTNFHGPFRKEDWILSELPTVTDSPSTQSTSSTTRQRSQKTIQTRLVLHLDINETILLGDEAGGDSRQDSVQKMLAKSAFCLMPPNTNGDAAHTEDLEPTHWWDGQRMGEETTIPPLYTGWEWPPNACPYYRTAYKKGAKVFCAPNHHGHIYRPLLQACEQAMTEGRKEDPHKTHILPAFYETLQYLIQQEQQQTTDGDTATPSFRVVFRTFGSDIDELARSVTRFAKGEHPDYPNISFPALELSPDRLYQGRWKSIPENDDPEDAPAKTHAIYELWDALETKVIASGDEEVLKLLSQHSVCGVRDDYPHWSKNGWDPTAGKPIWVPPYPNEETAEDGDTVYDHHIIFDDNIHNLADDGIVCIRKGQAKEAKQIPSVSYETVEGSRMHSEEDYQGIHLVRVPTVEPVLNPHWYIEKIKQARDRLQSKLVKR